MTMTNNDIIIYLDLLQKLRDVRGKLGWYIYRNIKILSDAGAETIKIRNEAVAKYGEKHDDKIGIGPSSDGWSDYLAEIKPILQIKQNIKMCKMPRNEFDELIKDADLSADEMIILDTLIVED